jgi:hypothetical protein
MEQKNDKKNEAMKKQMEDHLLIAKGKTQLATHKAEAQFDDLKEKAGAAIQTAKEKGTELLNSAKEQVDQVRKKTADVLEQAKEKL